MIAERTGLAEVLNAFGDARSSGVNAASTRMNATRAGIRGPARQLRQPAGVIKE